MMSKRYSKRLVLSVLVSAIIASLWLILPATLTYAEGGYGGAVGGGGGGGIPSSYTSFWGRIDENGVINQYIATETSDGLCHLTINSGTIARDRVGNPLASIFMVQNRYPPPAPPASSIMGLVYNLLPYGATFNPPIDIDFTYDERVVPEGVSEENLVIAYWKSGNTWINLEGPFDIDVENNIIRATVSHFTDFTVIAYTSPAAFAPSGLTISPGEVNPGQDIDVSVVITNTGDLTGSYEVALNIDNVVIATEKVTLADHNSQGVTFSITADYAVGDHTVSVDGLTGMFAVVAPAPPPPEPEPVPEPAPEPAPEPEPAPTPEPAPAPEPEAPALPPPEAPVTPVTPVTPINWWLWGGVIAVVIIILVVVSLIVARRRY